jgi:uncharacterized protein (TIGR02646 family)
MIYVDRSRVKVPEVLESIPARNARYEIELLLRRDAEYLAQRRMPFQQDIWSGTREALDDLFRGKCAYCETSVSKGNFDHIDHFRPFQGAEDLDGNTSHLHYSWLAYEWDNLFLTCPICTRSSSIGPGSRIGKGSRFPVEGPRAPLLSSLSTCRQVEQPLLIDPCHDNPEHHLKFNEGGICESLTPKGKVTIELLGLNRVQLVKARREAAQQMQRLLQNYILHYDTLGNETDMRAALIEALGGKAEYTATRRAVFEHMRKNFEPGAKRGSSLTADLDELEKKYLPRKTPPVIGHLSPIQVPQKLLFARELAVPPDFDDPRLPLPPFAHDSIRRIEISDFKAIESLDLVIPDGKREIGALALLGENATGKSSILEAISLALLGTAEIAKLKLKGTRFLRREHDESDTVPARHPAQIKLHRRGSGEPIVLSIDVRGQFSGTEYSSMVVLAFGPRRFFSEWKHQRSAGPHSRVTTLFRPHVALTNPRQWLLHCSEKRFSAAVRALRPLMLLPGDGRVKRRTGHRHQDILFHFGEEREEPLRRFSEGYRTVVATAVDVMREMLDYWGNLEDARGVVLIDEIDTHLHPRWKMRIISRLRQAMPQVQFIVTTHDPLCLRGFYDGEVKVMRRGPEGIESVQNLPSVQGLSVGQLLTSDYFGLASTEDPELETKLRRYVELASNPNRDPQEEEELARHREFTQSKLQLGGSPDEQFVYETIDAYLVRRKEVLPRQREGVKRDAMEKVLRLWEDSAQKKP